MTTIAIDCRFAGTGTGLARYTKELVTALLARSDGDIRYVLIVRSVHDFPNLTLPHRIVIADIPHYSLAEQTTLPKILREIGADLTFFPHFNAPFFASAPFVATVHDLILHRYPGDASLLKCAVYRVLVARALRRAKAVIAVSAWTKFDIERIYGKRIAGKATVTGEGVNETYVPQSPERIAAFRARYNLQRPFFLYVGNCKQHKNVPMLLEAFEQAKPDAELIIVSGGSDARTLILPRGVRLMQDVDDADLPLFYSAARCFVTASLDEGYCLPIAEALACGCPVIATNRASIPEILNGHGVLLEPTVEELAAALQCPPTLAAPVRVESWDDAAEKTARVLAQAVSKR